MTSYSLNLFVPVQATASGLQYPLQSVHHDTLYTKPVFPSLDRSWRPAVPRLTTHFSKEDDGAMGGVSAGFAGQDYHGYGPRSDHNVLTVIYHTMP